MKRELSALSAVLCLSAATASAADLTGIREPGTHGESERTSMLEFKLGGYKPLIENESGLSTNPYNQTFGASAMLLFETEYDRELFQKFGSASIAGSAGYAEKYGAATTIVENADGSITRNKASENTALKVVPLKLLGVYRLDYAALRWGIPLVPYAKLGLVYELWWSSEGKGVEYVSGQRAAGGRWGYQATAGLSLLLDVIEPRLAKDFDVDMGVNHSYFFAEYNYDQVNNFGAGGLDLSGRTWMFGLALEY